MNQFFVHVKLAGEVSSRSTFYFWQVAGPPHAFLRGQHRPRVVERQDVLLRSRQELLQVAVCWDHLPELLQGERGARQRWPVGRIGGPSAGVEQQRSAVQTRANLSADNSQRFRVSLVFLRT